MAHTFLLYAHDDAEFAKHLATQLQQRGLVVRPVPDLTTPYEDQMSDPEIAVETASHILLILSADALASDDMADIWVHALELGKQVVVIQCDACEIPAVLQELPMIDFQDRFLLAVEDLIKRLKKMKAPTRPLTVEHPPPVAKPELLPIILPPERCWREDRLRINYRLSIILTSEELAVRIPAFFVKTGFELTRSTAKTLQARRLDHRFHLFDPRRAEQTLTIQRRKGSLRMRYRMTRQRVWYWLPVHYRVLDREAAALYRYLAMEDLDEALMAVHKQARKARLVSWIVLTLWILLIVVSALSYLLVL